MTTAILDTLRQAVGAAHVLTDGDLSAYERDWRGRMQGKALAVVRPASTQEVAAVVKVCAAAGVAIIPQGGNTGLSVGSTPDASGTHLVLRYAPWNGAPAFADWATAEARILVRDVQGLHLRYQHPLSGAWQPSWSPSSDLPPGINLYLPSAIELAVDGPVPAWPPVVVALRASFITDLTARMGSTGR